MNVLLFFSSQIGTLQISSSSWESNVLFFFIPNWSPCKSSLLHVRESSYYLKNHISKLKWHFLFICSSPLGRVWGKREGGRWRKLFFSHAEGQYRLSRFTHTLKKKKRENGSGYYVHLIFFFGKILKIEYSFTKT